MAQNWRRSRKLTLTEIQVLRRPGPRIKKRRTACQCRFLPESDRKCLAKARQIQDISDTDSDIEDTKETPTFEPTVFFLLATLCPSELPYLNVFHQHTHVRWTFDSSYWRYDQSINHHWPEWKDLLHKPVRLPSGWLLTFEVVGETTLHFSRDSIVIKKSWYLCRCGNSFNGVKRHFGPTIKTSGAVWW